MIFELLFAILLSVSAYLIYCNRKMAKRINWLNCHENAFIEKQHNIELILKTSQVGLWEWDVVTGKIVVDENWTSMLGYEYDEAFQTIEAWEKSVHGDDWAEVNKCLQDHLNGVSDIYITEYRLRHKTGEWIWVQDVGQVYKRDGDGTPLLVRGMHLDITKMRSVLEKTKQDWKSSENIIANYLDGLIVLDAHLHIKTISKECCRLLDRSKNDLIDLAITEIFFEPAEAVNEIFNSFLEDPVSVKILRNVDLTLRAKNGQTKLPVSVNLSSIIDPVARQVTCIVVRARDVSRLRSALSRLKEQHQLVENIFESVPGGLLILRNNGSLEKSGGKVPGQVVVGEAVELLHYNRIFEQMTEQWCSVSGYERNVVEKLFLDRLCCYLESCDYCQFALEFSNSHVILECYASGTLKSEKNELVVFFRDISERVRNECLNRLHSAALRQTSDGVLITDTEGTIYFTNSALHKLSGYTGLELTGQPTSIFKSGVHGNEFYRDLWQTIKSGEVWMASMINSTKGGDLFEVEMTITPVVGDGGDSITHYVALWRDVSERRLLEQELLQAQKLEAVGRIAAGVVHELNTPIQYIQNNLFFIRDAFKDIENSSWGTDPACSCSDGFDSHDDDQRIHEESDTERCDFLKKEIILGLNESLEGVDHVVEIVRALKSFSHPNDNVMAEEDLNKIIQNAVLVTNNEWKYNADMETNLSPSLPLLVCNHISWSQVFLNLIVNSSHAIKGKGPKFFGKIVISTRHVDDLIEITVKDDGVGIPASSIQKIFEPFFTTKGVGIGTGQGLAIVYDIVVNKYFGKIDCESREGEGTVMTIVVPIHPPSQQP